MATNYQSQFANDFKNILKSYNININTSASGTYWDVTANSVGAVGAEVIAYLQQVADGNNPFFASSFMLEAWARGLNLTARKSGYYARGLISIDTPNYPIVVNRGSTFSVGTLDYEANDTFTVNSIADLVEVEAVNIGAEYNIRTGVLLQSEDFSSAVCTTQGIFGGSGQETDPLLLLRVLENIRNRKTDSQLTDYIQKALNYYNYASASPLFAEQVVPYGVEVVVANTVQDFDIAKTRPTIVDISASPAQLLTLEEVLQDSKSVGAVIQVGTIEAQEVPNLELNVTASTTLGSGTLDLIRQEVRKQLLQFTGEELFQHSLQPEISQYVNSWFFTNFTPITRTSITMDILLSNIAIVQN